MVSQNKKGTTDMTRKNAIVPASVVYFFDDRYRKVPRTFSTESLQTALNPCISFIVCNAVHKIYRAETFVFPPDKKFQRSLRLTDSIATEPPRTASMRVA